MKGNSDCHIPSERYRKNYDRVFRKPVINNVHEAIKAMCGTYYVTLPECEILPEDNLLGNCGDEVRPNADQC